jgi:hypothetical protein
VAVEEQMGEEGARGQGIGYARGLTAQCKGSWAWRAMAGWERARAAGQGQDWLSDN